MAMITFDRGEEGPSLRLMCFEGHGDGATVQIHVAAQPAIPPPYARDRRMMGHDYMNVLPAIFPPPHSIQQGGGGGAGPDHVDTRATLDTDLDVPAVGAHYRTQLERAGWQLGASGESGPVAWSAWAFKDDEGEPWSATFAALQQPGAPRHYDLWLSANYAGTNAGGPSSRRPIGSHTHMGLTTYGPMRGGR